MPSASNPPAAIGDRGPDRSARLGGAFLLLTAAATRYQRQVGGALRWIAPGSLVTGVAMQFIWIDSATILHPIVGTTFFLWLLAVGTLLSTGRVERRFVVRYGLDST